MVLRLFVVGCIVGSLFAMLQCANGQEVDKGRLRFDHLTVNDGLSQNTIHGIVKDKFGFMWFGTWEGVCRYDGYTFKVFRAGQSNPSGLSNNRISNVFVDSLQNLWVYNGNYRIATYDFANESFYDVPRDSVPAYVVNGLDRDNRYRNRVMGAGYVWSVGESGKGLIQTSHDGHTARYSKNPFEEGTLSDDYLTDLFIDNHGILWVGTENGGINKADTRAKPFVNYAHSPNNTQSLGSNVVRAIVEDKQGNIWVGTANDGITVIGNNGVYKHIRRQDDSNNGLVSNEIRHLFCDSRGDVWIGTKGGLNRYSPQTNRFDVFTRTSANPIPDNSVFWVMEDYMGVLWIGTFNGIARFDRAQNRFVPYADVPLLNNPKVRAIIEDHQHRLWVATEGGGVTVLERDKGFAVNGKLNKVQDFLVDGNNPNSLTGDIVLTLLEDNQNAVWMGTNNGLCRYIPSTGQMVHLTAETGFPDDLIMGLLKDNKGNVWVSHKKGLTCIAIEGQHLNFRHFTKNDGLPSNEFNQNAFFAGSGKLYFGGTAGLTAFVPDSIRVNPFPPQVAITGVKLRDKWLHVGEVYNGRVVLPQSLMTTASIELGYDDRDLSIGFVALHYANPLGNRYKYMLEGYDNDWVAADADNRVAVYANLPHGHYLFKVKAANCDGVWNNEPVALQITVNAPWWLTWWAYLGYALVASALLVVLVKFLRWRIQLKQQLGQMKNLIADRQQLTPEVVSAPQPQLNDRSVAALDDAFIKKAIAFIDTNLERPDFSQDELAEFMAVSKRQLYRKVFALTGQTVHGFITTIRMEKARNLLLEGQLTVSEVAYKVGFSEPSNFSRTFSKQYGKSPSAFLKK